MADTTVVVVRNSALYDIENDLQFASNLAEGIQRAAFRREQIEVRAGNCFSAARVIPLPPTEETNLIAFGASKATLLGQVQNGGAPAFEEEQVRILREAAEKLGYTLQKMAPAVETAAVEGWFDVQAYRTQDAFEGTNGGYDLFDGVMTLEDAKEIANWPSHDKHYEVVVVASGKHADYESGERVYARFNHALPKQVTA